LFDKSSTSVGSIYVAFDGSETMDNLTTTNVNNATDKNYNTYVTDTVNDMNVLLKKTTDNYSCAGDVSSLTDVEGEEITPYPNLAKNEVTIKGAQNEVVEVYDAMGKLVKQEKINETLNISDLTSGVY